MELFKWIVVFKGLHSTLETNRRKRAASLWEVIVLRTVSVYPCDRRCCNRGQAAATNNKTERSQFNWEDHDVNVICTWFVVMSEAQGSRLTENSLIPFTRPQIKKKMMHSWWPLLKLNPRCPSLSSFSRKSFPSSFAMPSRRQRNDRSLITVLHIILAYEYLGSVLWIRFVRRPVWPFVFRSDIKRVVQVQPTP